MPDASSQPRRRSGALFLWGVPALVLILGLVLLALLVTAIRRAEHERIALETRITTRQVALRLQAWMDNRLIIPEMLATQDQPSVAAVKAAYREQVTPFLKLFPGIQALNYIDPDGTIDMVAPEATNRNALGMDLNRHPSPGVREALQRARKSDRPAATPVIDLYQGGTGVAVYQAIRRHDQELLGLVNCVFRVDTLVNRCLQERDLRRDFRFWLVDESGREAYIHTDQPELAPASWPHAVAHQVIVVDRQWSLLVAPTPNFMARADSPYNELQGVMVMGLLLALAVTFHLLLRRQIALQESRSRYQLLVENQTDVLLEFDLDGNVTYASPSFYRLYGLDEDAVIGRGFVQRIHEDDLERALAGLAATRRPPDYEGRTEHRSLTRHGWRWMSWTGSGVLDAQGEVVASIATGRDITRQKELEDQLRQGQKMQAVGQLAGGIAHDFNNLLQAMLGYIEMLEKNPAITDPNACNDLAAVRRSSERAAELTGQLLAFSRQTVRSIQVLDLGEVLRDLQPLLKRLLPDRIELRVITPDQAEALVEADRGQLEQVAMNLCVNARDAIDNTGWIEISVDPAQDDSWVCLSVRDNGRGIEPEVQDRIFEPFYTTKDVGEGTGLGLATVYGIIEHHQGELELASAPGEGATFTVKLPRSLSPRPADVLAADGEAAPGGTETILLAEDEDALRDITSRVLTQAGYTVVAAVDGAHALELYEQKGPIQAAVLDVMMPRLGGRELAAELLRQQPEMPVVFISGHPSERQTQQLQQTHDVLLKPFDALTLLRRVRRTLDAR